MFDRILFPTDGSDGAAAAFDHVLDVAADHDATVHVLNVADTTQDSVTRVGRTVIDVLEESGSDVVDEAAERAAERGVETVTAVLQGGVAETITAYASDHEVDLIAMPTRGRTGLDRLLLGSTTERVVRRSTAPVLSVQPDGGPMRYPYRDILVPTDGSECAGRALDRAVRLAARSGATLHVLSVVDLGGLGIEAYSGIETLVATAEGIVEDAAAVAEAAGVETVEHVEAGSAPGRVIDLVAMGTRGRTGVERYLLGSVAERTVRTAPMPVLTVSEGVSEDDSAGVSEDGSE
jgi:nucleotide-binding universal stress UspA family protein